MFKKKPKLFKIKFKALLDMPQQWAVSTHVMYYQQGKILRDSAPRVFSGG
jgi:hypothetical protein